MITILVLLALKSSGVSIFGQQSAPPFRGQQVQQVQQVQQGPVQAPATMRVRLPADAVLTIDGNATQSTSASRVFVSPPLEPANDYSYDLRANIVRGGKSLTVSKLVTVRAGEETPVDLQFPEVAVAEK